MVGVGNPKIWATNNDFARVYRFCRKPDVSINNLYKPTSTCRNNIYMLPIVYLKTHVKEIDLV